MDVFHKRLKELLPSYMDVSTVSEVLGRLKELASSVLSRQVVFLFGAGMSYDSGMALFTPLVRRMVRDLCLGEVDLTDADLEWVEGQYPSEAIAQAYDSKKGSAKLNDLIMSNYKDVIAEPHDGHKILPRFIESRHVDRFYTTNWDTLIEDALSEDDTERAVSITESNVAELGRTAASGAVPVVHLHGAVASDHKCLITERDTYRTDTRLHYILSGELMTKSLVLIGYSMRDIDLRSVYLRVSGILGKDLARQTYVVTPLTQNREWEWRLADYIWGSRGVVLIPVGAKQLLPYLADLVDDVSADDVLAKISRETGENDVRVLNKEIDQRMEDMGVSRAVAVRTLAFRCGVLKGSIEERPAGKAGAKGA